MSPLFGWQEGMVAGWGKTRSRAGDCLSYLKRRGFVQAGAAGPALPDCRRSGPSGAGSDTKCTTVGLYAYVMKLHNYFRSSSSYRVRIAMELKGLKYDYIPVHIAKGEHKQEPYASISADTLVPLLEVDGQKLSQSLAIIEYLDEKHPTPALLPADAVGRAKVRALAQSIACELHPINNLRVLKYLSQVLKLDDEAKNTWYRHWCREGLEAFERQLAQLPKSTYCYGDTPTLADCCLVPQIFNAQRFKVNFDGLPRTMAAYEAGMALPAVQKAQPSACPDFES